MTARASVASLLAACLLVVAADKPSRRRPPGPEPSPVMYPARADSRCRAFKFRHREPAWLDIAADGRFTIANVPAGTHQLRSVLIGMKPDLRSVTVTAGATTDVSITMAKQTLVLEQIVVTGTAGGARARELGNAVSVVDRAMRSTFPSTWSRCSRRSRPASPCCNAPDRSAAPRRSGFAAPSARR